MNDAFPVFGHVLGEMGYHVFGVPRDALFADDDWVIVGVDRHKKAWNRGLRLAALFSFRTDMTGHRRSAERSVRGRVRVREPEGERMASTREPRAKGQARLGWAGLGRRKVKGGAGGVV